MVEPCLIAGSRYCDASPHPRSNSAGYVANSLTRGFSCGHTIGLRTLPLQRDLLQVPFFSLPQLETAARTVSPDTLEFCDGIEFSPKRRLRSRMPCFGTKGANTRDKGLGNHPWAPISCFFLCDGLGTLGYVTTHFCFSAAVLRPGCRSSASCLMGN